MRRILFVIDMQKDFVTGSLGSPMAQAIVPAIQGKIKETLEENGRVIFTRDTHAVNYSDTREGKNLPVPHCIKETEGWNIIDELQTKNCTIIDKPTFGYYNWAKVYSKEEYELLERAGLSDGAVKFEDATGVRFVTSDIFTKEELEDMVAGNAVLDFTGVCTDICVISNIAALKAIFAEADFEISENACAATSDETQQATLKVLQSIQVKVIPALPN